MLSGNLRPAPADFSARICLWISWDRWHEQSAQLSKGEGTGLRM